MRSIVVGICLLLGACSTEPAPTTTTVTVPPSTTSTTTDVAGLDACDPPHFLPTTLPVRVAATQPESRDIPLDQFTILPGTTIRVWAGASGAPVMVMIRGALPPEKWTGTPERIIIRGVEAALGPLENGVWAAAWFEGPDSCDEYSLIFYPPVDAEEARAVAESVSGP